LLEESERAHTIWTHDEFQGSCRIPSGQGRQYPFSRTDRSQTKMQQWLELSFSNNRVYLLSVPVELRELSSDKCKTFRVYQVYIRYWIHSKFCPKKSWASRTWVPHSIACWHHFLKASRNTAWLASGCCVVGSSPPLNTFYYGFFLPLFTIFDFYLF